MYINNQLETDGKFLLVYEYGEYDERNTILDKFKSKEELLSKVNSLSNSNERVSIYFAGEIHSEFKLVPKEVVTKYGIEE